MVTWVRLFFDRVIDKVILNSVGLTDFTRFRQGH